MICDEKDVIRKLKESYLFQNFVESELQSISALTRCRQYLAKEPVFERGSPAASLYILGYGSVGLEVNDSNGFSRNQVVLTSGQTFGDSHLHLREQHLARAITLEVSEIFQIDFDELEEFLGDHPVAELKFTRALSTHLGRYCHHLLEGVLAQDNRIVVNEGISSFV